MATRPEIKSFTGVVTNASVDVLNAIRNSSSTEYRDYVPIATENADDIRAIGNIIMDNPQLRNEFLNNLVNRIGKVLINSKFYTNPWEMFKKGYLDYGETIEEIFVELSKPFTYDPERAETKHYAREIPDVRTAYHLMNYRKFYKVTVHREELRKAFTSINGVTSLIEKIVNTMYSTANYDEFLVMKYMIAKHLLDGRINPVQIPEVSKTTAKDIVTICKEVSNNMEFMNPNHNIAHVHTFTPKDQQYIIVSNKFDAIMDVEVLASAFNMDKAQFIGHRVTVDGFGMLDMSRLEELLDDDPNFRVFTKEELEALNKIPAIICDKDWFMIYDNLQEVTEDFNREGLYWNYWLHLWKMFSISPFTQAVSFVPMGMAVNSVTVSPTTATLKVGNTLPLGVKVYTEGFIPKTVNYVLDPTSANIVSVNNSGIVTALSKGEAKIEVVSTESPEVKATVTITVE